MVLIGCHSGPYSFQRLPPHPPNCRLHLDALFLGRCWTIPSRFLVTLFNLPEVGVRGRFLPDPERSFQRLTAKSHTSMLSPSRKTLPVGVSVPCRWAVLHRRPIMCPLVSSLPCTPLDSVCNFISHDFVLHMILNF